MALRALTDGKMPVKCVPGRLAMARLRPDAFPGGNPWQFFHSMYPKRGLGREKGGFVARCARHVSEKPRKSPLEDTPREYLARKGPFSLHGHLESCTARRSCHPASANHPSARNLCAAEQCEPPAITAPPSWRGSPRNTPPGTAPNRPSARNPAPPTRPRSAKAQLGGQPRRKRSRAPHQRQRSAL